MSLKKINLLEMSISLPPSNLTKIKEYTLPAAAQSGIDSMVKKLGKPRHRHSSTLTV